MNTPRDLELLYEIGSLRHLQRSWRQYLGIDCANDLEHTLRVIWIALVLARRGGHDINEEKLMKMALVHDLAEARTGDHAYVQRLYVEEKEDEAFHDQLEGTVFEDFWKIQEEYKTRESIEAQLVKDADNLDCDIEFKEFEERGHQLTKKWTRTQIREKLYTEAGRQLWEEIHSSDPSSWHRRKNKYTHDKNHSE